MAHKYEKKGSHNYSPTGIGTTNGKGEGDIMYHGSTSVTQGRLYVLTYVEASEWVLADADNSTSGNLLAVAMGTGAADTVGMFLRGMLYNTGGSAVTLANAGKPIYISTSAGVMTSTIPTASNDYVRIVGYNIANNVMWFNPDNSFIKIA
tara:strand:- start:260 stop:709 length:450 start_codon:yes stop_codon:yes gene_type:complete